MSVNLITLAHFAVSSAINFVNAAGDIGMAMPLVLQLWMFGSPVVYSLRQVPERYRDYYVLNPMVGIIENFRAALLGSPLDRHALAISTALSLVLLPVSYLYFKRVEATVADVI